MTATDEQQAVGIALFMRKYKIVEFNIKDKYKKGDTVSFSQEFQTFVNSPVIREKVVSIINHADKLHPDAMFIIDVKIIGSILMLWLEIQEAEYDMDTFIPTMLTVCSMMGVDTSSCFE